MPQAYKFSTDMAKQSRENASMLERCVTAVENLSPSFEFIVLPTGGKVLFSSGKWADDLNTIDGQSDELTSPLK